MEKKVRSAAYLNDNETAHRLKSEMPSASGHSTVAVSKVVSIGSLWLTSTVLAFDHLETSGSTTWHDATKPFPKMHPCSSVLLGT